MKTLLKSLIITSALFAFFTGQAQTQVHPDARFAEAEVLNTKANGFKGIWYMNQPSNDMYVYKYSGGMGTYTAKHRPLAVYSKKVNKTFFCFGGSDDANSTLFHNVSYFDHTTGEVANPTVILDKKTNDAHDNPVISIDDKGYIWVFSTSHGTNRPSYISKSDNPYDITKFNIVNATEVVNGKEVPFDNFSYFQVWHVKGKGFMALFTKYDGWNSRVIGYNTSNDGVKWNEWKVIGQIDMGHYQVSGEQNGKIATAFNYHPQGKGLNYRTNLYYLETTDFGKSWQTATGEKVQLPLTQPENPALVKEYKSEGLNCYMKDLNFDEKGNPVLMVVSSKGYQSGPENNPRTWEIFSFDGKWNNSKVTNSDNNYDTGSIYIEANGTWRIIGPTIPGPQAFNPGGEIAIWTSSNKGASWQMTKQITSGSVQNHNYVRRAVDAQPDFYGFWADGHGRQPSGSTIYFCDQKGTVYALPKKTTEAIVKPLAIPVSDNFDFKNWPEGKSPQEIGQRIAEKFLSTAHSRYGNTRPETPPTQITYPDVCTWLGGLWFAEATGNEKLSKRFEERFLPLFGSEKYLQPKPNHVDNNVFGVVPLELYLKTKQQKYLDLGLFYANTQWALPNNAKPEEKTWADKGYTWQTRIWIDDMFMITALQAQAFRATGDAKYIDRTAKEMVLYLDEIQLENGLFYHSPEAHYSWGRGNGWMAVGMAELLRILPKNNPNHKRILDGYHKMMGALLKYQEPDGMWRQIIDEPEAWKETSATAMFTYAMITGVKNGWLDKKIYGTAARKGWLGVIGYINNDDELTEVCEGTNIKNDRNHYMQRKRIVGDLHGQAPLLWCAVALLR